MRENVKVVDVWKLAEENNLLPEFCKAGKHEIETRDGKTAAIQKLARDYAEWAIRTNTIVCPGPEPEHVNEPLEPPPPTASQEEHKRYREVMDRWFDDYYLSEFEPKYQVWLAARKLWFERKVEQKLEKIDAKDKLIKWAIISVLTAGVSVTLFFTYLSLIQ